MEELQQLIKQSIELLDCMKKLYDESTSDRESFDEIEQTKQMLEKEKMENFRLAQQVKYLEAKLSEV